MLKIDQVAVSQINNAYESELKLGTMKNTLGGTNRQSLVCEQQYEIAKGVIYGDPPVQLTN